MASTNSVSGLSSGFDWQSMVDQLISVEKNPVTLVQNQKSRYEEQLSEWKSFNTKLLSLKTAAQAISNPDDFNLFTSSMTSDNADVDAEDLLTVSANSYASVGSYNITVNNVAAAQKISSGIFSSGTDALGAGYNGEIIINGKSITLSETDGLDDIRNRINSADAGVTAGIIRYSDSDYRLNLTSNSTGAKGISLENGSATDLLQLLGWKDAEGVVNEIVAGRDASLTIDGETVTSEDNTIDDVLSGLTLKLTDDDAYTTITLNIERDISSIEEKIQSFVDAYNAITSYIKEQQNYDKENKTTGGVLFGDGTLSSVKSDLTSLLVQPLWGVSSDFSILGLAGINVDEDGQLSIDSETLNGFLETNFNDIRQLFTANGTSDSGEVEYLYSTNDTKAGEYAVNITRPALQNNSTSTNLVGGALSSDETLTITSGDNVATITLTGGMTISDIVSAVNTELDTAYSEKLVGSTGLTAGSVPVTSATTWGAIDGASLVNGDIIAFTGSTRDGDNISGSYTISDTSTNTIQGLLSEIRSAFDYDVSASIDGSGHIVLTDSDEGTSSLSLFFDYTGTTNRVDIFGTVSAGNTGGHEGRYAMGITASVNGSSQLKLTSDSYGSGNSFTISESTQGLWSGTTVVNNGQDIAGTINGEAATGSGQNLTGNDGEANIAGLVIRYTGSATGNIGSIKFTTGVAELFDRALFNITDSYEGYVAFKQDSLSERISDLEDRIDQMNDRLDKKKETLLARFTAMELTLSRLQNMSSWLTGQLSAASGGWR